MPLPHTRRQLRLDGACKVSAAAANFFRTDKEGGRGTDLELVRRLFLDILDGADQGLVAEAIVEIRITHAGLLRILFQDVGGTIRTDPGRLVLKESLHHR